MATRNSSNAGVTPVDTIGEMYVVTWTGLLNGDDGAAIQFAEFADKSIQFSGTFGTGGSITFEGSNDTANPPTNWFPLTDLQGNAITKTAAALEQVAEATAWVRPRVTAGDVNTNLVATLFLRRGNYVR